MSTKTLMTVEEFVQMNTDETEGFELVDGELILLSSPAPLHARVRGRLERLIASYFEQNPIGEAFGETDCRISGDTVRCPDISVFLGERQNFDVTKIPIPYAPDIAVEVLSQSEKVLEVNRKVLDYLAAGGQEVWLLDQANCEVFVHTATAVRVYKEADRLETPLLPGFAAPLKDLLAG